MVKSLSEMIDTLEKTKSLSSICDWQKSQQKSEIGSAIEIAGIIEEGIAFRANCKPNLPEECVTILLLAETKKRQRAFARIDWRGQRHINTNKKLCASYWGDDAGRSHFHDPRLHAHIDDEVLFDTQHIDLPIAQKLDYEPKDFNQLLEYSAKILKIENLTDLPYPPWPTTPSFL